MLENAAIEEKLKDLDACVQAYQKKATFPERTAVFEKYRADIAQLLLAPDNLATNKIVLQFDSFIKRFDSPLLIKIGTLEKKKALHANNPLVQTFYQKVIATLQEQYANTQLLPTVVNQFEIHLIDATSAVIASIVSLLPPTDENELRIYNEFIAQVKTIANGDMSNIQQIKVNLDQLYEQYQNIRKTLQKYETPTKVKPKNDSEDGDSDSNSDTLSTVRTQAIQYLQSFRTQIKLASDYKALNRLLTIFELFEKNISDLRQKAQKSNDLKRMIDRYTDISYRAFQVVKFTELTNDTVDKLSKFLAKELAPINFEITANTIRFFANYFEHDDLANTLEKAELKIQQYGENITQNQIETVLTSLKSDFAQARLRSMKKLVLDGFYDPQSKRLGFLRRDPVRITQSDELITKLSKIEPTLNDAGSDFSDTYKSAIKDAIEETIKAIRAKNSRSSFADRLTTVIHEFCAPKTEKVHTLS